MGRKPKKDWIYVYIADSLCRTVETDTTLWSHLKKKETHPQGDGSYCCSVTQSCPTLCDPMDCSTPGLPVHHQLPEFTQTQVHRVSDAIQPSHPLLSPSPPALNLSQHQGLLQWVSIRCPKYWSFSFSIIPSNEYSGLISFRIDWLDLLAVQGSLKSSPTSQLESISSSVLSLVYGPTLTSVHDYWKNIVLTMMVAGSESCLAPSSRWRHREVSPQQSPHLLVPFFPWFLYGNNSQRSWSWDIYCRPSCIHPDFQASFCPWFHPWCYYLKRVLCSRCVWVWDPEYCLH